MSVGADRYSKSSRQTKVCQFDLPLGVDEEVLGLQVSMKNSVRVAEGQALQQLEEITLETQDSKVMNQVWTVSRSSLQTDAYLHQRQRDASHRGRVHELFKVLMEELKNKIEFVLRVNHILQPGKK